MNGTYEKVASGGMDVYYKFSNAAFRDAQGALVREAPFMDRVGILLPAGKPGRA